MTKIGLPKPRKSESVIQGKLKIQSPLTAF